MSKADEMLKMLEELTKDKTVQEIHEITQKAIARAERNNPDDDIEGVIEFFCLIERHLVERTMRKAPN